MSRRKVAQKKAENKVQEFMNRGTTNVEHEIYDHTINNNWSVRNSNKGLKNILEAIPGKHSINSSQNTAIQGTSHVMPEVLESLEIEA